MPILRYPRFGQRLAPRLLHQALQVPVDDYVRLPGLTRATQLCDLDESMWQRATSSDCIALARAIIQHLMAVDTATWDTVRQLRLPQPPQGTELETLELGQRTYNCLRRVHPNHGGFAAWLGQRPIADVMKLRSFGVTSLVDLLTSLETLPAPCEIVPPGAAAAEPATAEPMTVSDTRANLIREVERLASWPGVAGIRGDDGRLGPIMAALDPGAATVGELLKTLRNGQFEAMAAGAKLARLQVLHRRISEISGLCLEDEILDIMNCVRGRAASARNHEIVLRRYGWTGRGPRTLQDVAWEYGICRERVRQICEPVDNWVERVAHSAPYAPALSRVLQFMAEQAPLTVPAMESKLAAAGLTRSPLAVSVPLQFARDMRVDSPVKVWQPGHAGRAHQYVVHTGADAGGEAVDSAALKAIVRIARGLVRHWGATTTTQLLHELQSQAVAEAVAAGPALETDVLVRVLEAQSDFGWLDQERHWFWLADVTRNRLIQLIAKVMAVVERLEGAALNDAVQRRLPHSKYVGRRYADRGPALPTAALLEICRRAPGYRVDDEIVSAEVKRDMSSVLAPTEFHVAQVLQAHGTLMRRAALDARCAARNVKADILSATLATSPVVQRYAKGIYGLPGLDLLPGVLEAMGPTHPPRHRGPKSATASRAKSPRASRPAPEAAVDTRNYGMLATGKVWMICRVSHNMRVHGRWTLPRALRTQVKGRFALRDLAGSPLGWLVREHDQICGLGPYLRRGATAGDYLLIIADPVSKQARLQVRDAPPTAAWRRQIVSESDSLAKPCDTATTRF